MVTIEVLSSGTITTATPTTTELERVIADVEMSPIGTEREVVSADASQVLFKLTKVPDHATSDKAYTAFIDALTSKDTPRIAASVDALLHWAYDTDRGTVRQLAMTAAGYALLDAVDDKDYPTILRDLRALIGEEQ